MSTRPGSVLFACTWNSIRSPMAGALAKRLYGTRMFIESVGVRRGELDPFAVEVMDEIGIAIDKHRPRSFEDLEDSSYDVIITLSPEAQHHAVEMTRTMACSVEYWPVADPSDVEGSRDRRLDAYRAVRDALEERIKQRFGPVAGPVV